jgi:cell division protein FtsQ
VPRAKQDEQNTADRPIWSAIRWPRFIFWLVVGLFSMVGTLFAWHRTEEFLIKDDRFRLVEAEELDARSPNLIVEGIHYASASQIRHLFAEDLGRSLYLVPIQKRRDQLLAIDWVEDATVSKIWPNTLKVRIHEREPVAFVRLASNRRDGVSQFALIDKDGYILRPRVAAKFTLPVISGIRESESMENRRARVRRVLGMLKEVGPLAGQISEIDVADPNDLIVAEHVGGNVVNLMLGDENFPERLQNFLSNYEEIKQKRPDATTLDLRVDGLIRAVGDNQRDQ